MQIAECRMSWREWGEGMKDIKGKIHGKTETRRDDIRPMTETDRQRRRRRRSLRNRNGNWNGNRSGHRLKGIPEEYAEWRQTMQQKRERWLVDALRDAQTCRKGKEIADKEKGE
jgi:hypothetical protein